jgi:hypothetical protein
MVRPLLLAEPGPGDASCTIWTLTVFIYLAYLRAGRPSSNSAFRSSPALRPSPYVSNLSIFFVRFRSCDLLRSRPICRSSPYVSGLATFSVLPATPTFRLVRFLPLNGQLFKHPSNASGSSGRATGARQFWQPGVWWGGATSQAVRYRGVSVQDPLIKSPCRAASMA